MNAHKLILLYSFRIVRREWRRFVLPFLSLSITSVVLLLMLLLTGASRQLLSDQARELQGGDIVLESTSPIPGATFFADADIKPDMVSEQLSFSGTLQSDTQTAPFTIEVVDASYPLYGELRLKSGVFTGMNPGEVLLDEAGMKSLGVTIGDSVTLGGVSLRVMDEVITEPTSLFGGFRFLPKVFMSQASFRDAQIDTQLLRAEYTYAAKIPSLTKNMIESLRGIKNAYPDINVDVAGVDQQGLQFGLETVSDFLVLAVLVTAILAATNVYASILYLITIERKSLAVLLALGLTKKKLLYVLGAALLYVVVLAGIIGVGIGLTIFTGVKIFVLNNYLIALPNPSVLLYCGISISLIFLIAIMAFVPAVKKSLELNPKQILIGGNMEVAEKYSYRSVITITLSTLIPLVALSSYLLKSFAQGFLAIAGIALLYMGVALLYAWVLHKVYQVRMRAPFMVRSIISQKYADGLFGIVSFSSLFVALTALCTLSLIQVSLERFLKNDLSETVPSTYILDVQPSQKESLIEKYPDIRLFSNIRARIVSIDALRIQDELKAVDSNVSRELGREFNLTARDSLLTSESITAGEWSGGKAGEISVDENFADQANISIGSKIVFLVQGFEVSGIVTSFRKTDSRSGLPFFYFILAPEDVDVFPSVYFGYAYYGEAQQADLGRLVATEMPNVSIIKTQSIGPLLMKLIATLMTLVLIVTIPPLLIATLLIATLVLSSYAMRRREGARFRAIGLSQRESFWQYLFESLSLTVIAAVFSYGVSVLISGLISSYFLKLDTVVLFDQELLLGLSLIIFFIMGIAFFLYKSDTIQLRELLSYE
ncbi:MAG: FtsX-like permease family protein [Candidatus Moranbacteria bacterium]|jgi:putative ABC transport system permease protein|nr:FtsX-like permease family protein [Candidatus Moranbacteria bacterium]MBP9801042.1 FtsX-like permease family protein [Candidatus Moranbacteria bacterium]